MRFAIVCFFLFGCSEVPKNSCSYFTGWAMTMPYHVTVGKRLGLEEDQSVRALIQHCFEEVDKTVNNWNEESEISLLNRAEANQAIKASEHLLELISLSKKIFTLTGGRFDPTIEPLSKLWEGALARGEEPTAQELIGFGQLIGFDRVHSEGKTVWKEAAGIRLDLCALSKGYCIDLIAERLEAAGLKDFFIEWAGEVRAMGRHPDEREWTVQIEPGSQSVPLQNLAMATSGDYAQEEWGKGYFHIIDPKSHRPMVKREGSIAAATVVAPSCALADALATSFMLFPNEEEALIWAEELVKEIPKLNFWIFVRLHEGSIKEEGTFQL